MTDLDKVKSYYTSKNLAYNEVIEGSAIGVALVPRHGVHGGYKGYDGLFHEFTLIQQLGDFIEFDKNGSMTSFSQYYEATCMKLGLYVSEKDTGITSVKVRLFRKNEYVRTSEGVGIVIKVDGEYRTINRYACFIRQLLSIQYKSGYGEKQANAIKEHIDWGHATLITKEEYDTED